MANDKDFTLKDGIEVGGPTKNSLGTINDGSVGFNIADAAYTSKSLSTPFGGAIGLTLGNNGTRVYVTKYNTPASIVQYNLSTAYDLSTSSDPSKSLNVSSQAPYPAGVYFKSDGSKVYTLGMNNDDVFQYSLSTPWDISTGSYDNVTLQESGLGYRDIYFKPDGTKMYIVCSTGADNIRQYALSTAWDLSTASYESKSLDVSAQETSATEGVFLSSDGTKAYTVGQGTNAVAQYNLTTPFDISTGSYSGTSFSVSSQVATSNAVSFSDDGTNMYVLDAGDGDVHQYTSSKTVKNVDLSTSNFFTHTPAGATTYSFTNPGAVQSFQMQLTGGQEAAASSFSTTTYTGTGAAQTISNGLDLSSDGGLVWVKRRDATNSHSLWDSARGINYWLSSDSTSAQIDYSTNAMQSFNTNGFTLGTDSVTNGSGNSMVSWAFKKTPKFFDVVTYTGNGTSGRSISHSLNGNVGTILFKRTDSTSNWIVWHRSAGGAYGFLDATDAFTADSGISNPTTTAFTIESTINPGWNASGGTYVAYLFAHDTDASSLIKCGSYTGNASTDGPTINLGWQPQWIMIKNTSTSPTDWLVFDDKRGISASGNDALLNPNKATAENNLNDFLSVTSTGFKLGTIGYGDSDTSGNNYIYVAIRSAAATAVTWPNSVKFQGGTAPQTPALGEVDTYTFTTRDGGTSYIGVQSGNNHS